MDLIEPDAFPASVQDLKELDEATAKTTAIVREELVKQKIVGYTVQVTSAPNLRRKGVRGDEPFFGYPMFLEIRAADGSALHPPHRTKPDLPDFLGKISERVGNEVPQACGVEYDITPV